MATFSIDNDRTTAAIDDVTYDQSAGVQTLSTTDKGNEVDVTSSAFDGLNSGFKDFLANLVPALSSAQKDFAVLTDAASSSNTFIKVTADPGETLNDLKLLADSSTPLTDITTLAGESLFVHVDATGNYATLWTSSDDSGRIVGAVALTNENIDNVTTHTATAGVQMIFFEPINHPDADDNDDTVSLSDVLRVAVDTAVSFDFDQLDAGNFLWAAVGDGGAAMLITGQDLNVKTTGKPSAQGDIVHGGSDPSDTVNTSKATDTTIGINAQHFAATTTGDGSTGVFTFVKGYAPLELADPVFTGQNVTQIDYDDYINVNSASVFISQLTGGSTAKIKFSFFEAGGGGIDKAPIALVPEESFSYIGDTVTDSHLTDDTAVAIASVTIDGFTWIYNGASNGTLQGGIRVTITGNGVIVDGAQANDLITFTALDTASTVDGTFNRIDIQALQGSAAFDIGHIDLTSGGTTSAGLGSHLLVDDDGPKIAVEDTDGTYAAGATGDWTHDPGTDGFAAADSFGVTFDSYEIDSKGPVTTTSTNSTFSQTGDFAFEGSITDDINGDGKNDTVEFTLTFNQDDTYDLQVTTPPNTETTFDTSQGTLKAGGPDAVQTLLFGGSEAGDDDIVFFGVVATAPTNGGAGATDDLLDLVVNGATDKTESQIEGLFPIPTLINPSTQMNVSTAGIGINNNNLNGDANAAISLGDESFVVNPETVVDRVTVFIDNSVGGYNPATESLYYTVYYTDGTVSTPIKVAAPDLDPVTSGVAKGGVSFVIDGGLKQIDAVQLTMAQGTIKIPVISFSVEQVFVPQPLQLDFTATLVDGDLDSQPNSFSVDLHV